MAKKLHNILVRRIADKKIIEYAHAHFRGKLIDIGCGIKPYREQLKGIVDSHIGVDHADTQHDINLADLVGSAYAIPVEDASFDSALCSAVLEHLEEPALAIAECHRVLKPGGKAVYSIPFIWHLHEQPRDFYRYSKYGIEYLFKQANFEIVKLEALSGFWVTFGQLFVYYIYRFNRGPLRWFKIVDLIGLIVQGLAYLLDKLDRAEDWTWMYIVAVQKKTAAQQAETHKV